LFVRLLRQPTILRGQPRPQATPLQCHLDCQCGAWPVVPNQGEG
jgi:hypothetical protein